MTPNEFELAADMLELASNEFSRHTCDDTDDKIFKGWTDEEKKNLVQEIKEWSGDPDGTDNIEYIPNWELMDFLAYKLNLEAD